MSLKDKTKIVKLVDEKATELNPLYERFEEYYRRITSYRFVMPVEGGKAGGEYDNFTTNKPKTLIKKVTNTLARAPLHIQFTIDDDNEVNRKAKNNAERFHYGIINLANENFANKLLPTLQSQMSYNASLYGWYAERAFINLGEDGCGVPRVAVWQMIGVTWGMGKNGLAWGNHKTRIRANDARAEWGKSIEGFFNTKKRQIPDWYSSSKNGYVTKYDWWDEETNSIIIEKNWAKPPTEHLLKHVPILIVVSGNAPPPETLTGEPDDIKYWGQSVLDDNMLGYDQFEKQMTYRQTMVAEGVHAPMGIWSPKGKKELERSPFGKGRVIQFDSDTKEDAKPLTTPSTPDDADGVLAVIDDELMIGGAARVLHGIDAPGGSGRRAGILGAFAAESLLSAPKEAVERGIAWLGRELLNQYGEGSFKGLKLRGEDWKNEKFNVDLKPSDVKGEWYPEVKIMPKIPEDKHVKNIDAIALVNNKLLSKETVRDLDLGVRDSDLEAQKIDREEAMELPPIKIRRWAAAVVEEGGEENRFLAQAILAEIEKQESELPRPEADLLEDERVVGGGF